MFYEASRSETLFCCGIFSSLEFTLNKSKVSLFARLALEVGDVGRPYGPFKHGKYSNAWLKRTSYFLRR